MDWPLTVEDELRQGVDESAFTSKLARFFAHWAGNYAQGDNWDRAVADLTHPAGVTP